MRIATAFLAFLFGGTLSGCLTTAAILTSPDILVLEKPPPDKFFVMETDIETESGLMTIKSEWHCSYSATWNAGSGWGRRLREYSQTEYVAKSLSSGRFLIMRAKSGCSDKTIVSEHYNNVGILDFNSSTFEVLNNPEPIKSGRLPKAHSYSNIRDNRIKRSRIIVVSGSDHVKHSPDEIRVAEWFYEHNLLYYYVLIRAWDVKSWNDNVAAKDRVSKLKTISFASDLGYNQQGRQSANSHPRFGDPPSNNNLVHSAEILVNDEEIQLNRPDLFKADALVYHWADNIRKKRSYELCIDTTCRQIAMRSAPDRDQVYDPKTKRIFDIGSLEYGRVRNLL